MQSISQAIKSDFYGNSGREIIITGDLVAHDTWKCTQALMTLINDVTQRILAMFLITLRTGLQRPARPNRLLSLGWLVPVVIIISTLQAITPQPYRKLRKNTIQSVTIG